MSQYAVVKEYTDDTFTVEFFRNKEDAIKYAEQVRGAAKEETTIKAVVVYQAAKE